MPIKVFDFFSGCGGTSLGLKAAGMDIVLSIDNDATAQKTFDTNFPDVKIICKDIREIDVLSIEELVQNQFPHPLLFCACAPCQPFTRQNTTRQQDDGRTFLLCELGRFVAHYQPEFVFIENVPGMQKATGDVGPLQQFIVTLEELGYYCAWGTINSQDYGVPQRRERLVLIASRLGEISFPQKTHGPGTANPDYSTVWEWIGDLPPIVAGEAHPTVPNHRAANLSPLNLRRIMATPEGGGRRDWPASLRLECHSNGYKGHSDVYGRMWKHLPASGLTTRCISLSNGRFGHPEQHRAISVREAACLQTFPRDFIFYGSWEAMGRQIGNAVPALLAQRFGEAFIDHLHEHHGRGLE